jgi:hypothetical protein
MADGKLPAGASFEPVRYVRFRKQLTTRPSTFSNTSGWYEPYRTLALAKERTVFVVNAEALEDFLSDFELDNGSLRPLG